MKTKKIFALFLSIILMFGICVPTFAAVPNTDPIMPLYNVASGMLADIYISGSTITSICEVNVNKSCVVKIQITIQKFSSDTNTWENYKTFSAQNISSGNPRVLEKTASNVPSGIYRTKAYVEVRVNGILKDSDTVYSYSASK